MNTNNINSIPLAVASYLDAANRFDAIAAAACFTSNAVVRDEGKEHVGQPAIERWVLQTGRAYRPHVAVASVQVAANDDVRMVVKVTGDFPGSPAELNYAIRLQEGKIAQLRIL